MLPGMARLARVVTPGLPHHVTQPGNGARGRFSARGVVAGAWNPSKLDFSNLECHCF